MLAQSRSERGSSDIGIKCSIEIFRETQEFKGYASVRFEEFIDVHLEQHENDEFQSEIILERRLHDKLLTHFSEKFEALRNKDDQTFYVTDEMISYSPWLMVQESTTYAGITACDNDAMKVSSLTIPMMQFGGWKNCSPNLPLQSPYPPALATLLTGVRFANRYPAFLKSTP